MLGQMRLEQLHLPAVLEADQILRRHRQGNRVADGFVEAIMRAISVEERLLIVGALIEVVAEFVVDGLEVLGVDLDALLHAEIVNVVDVPG